jgi:hypothetical protein
MRLERPYYHCRHCKSGHCPFDTLLRLDASDLTPAAQQAVAMAGLLSAFAEAREKVLPELAGLRLGESTVERTTEGAGLRLRRWRQAGRVFGPKVVWPWQADATGRSVAYVSIDATAVGQQGPRGARADGRMAYVAQVYNPPPRNGGGAPGPPARVLSGLYQLEELGRQLRREAAAVGMDRAEVWVALTDGGNGLEDFIRVHFPRAALVLDFYHAAEHLNDLAKAWEGGVEERSRSLAEEWCHQLKHKGGVALLATLEGLELKRRSSEVRRVHEEVTRYVRNNVHRMDYPKYRSQGWLIGSGHIEAACKSVVGQRLKGCGMRWSSEGADAVCHLRALFKSGMAVWEAFWAAKE